MNRRNLIAALVFSVCLSPNAEAQQSSLDIKVKADKKVAELPSGPLFWRLEGWLGDVYMRGPGLKCAVHAQTSTSGPDPSGAKDIGEAGFIYGLPIGLQGWPAAGPRHPVPERGSAITTPGDTALHSEHHGPRRGSHLSSKHRFDQPID